jgi:beta-galactosidase
VHADDADTRPGGGGAAYCVSTALGRAGLRKLLQSTCHEAGAQPDLRVPPGVEAVRRCAGEQSFLFLLNHNQEAIELRVPERCRDLLAGRLIENSCLQLDALEWPCWRIREDAPY